MGWAFYLGPGHGGEDGLFTWGRRVRGGVGGVGDRLLKHTEFYQAGHHKRIH